MVVSRVERNFIRKDKERNELLRGIKCRWFTLDGQLQEAIWNTKDLYKIE